MDYIYINELCEKCVGEISSIEVTPYYQFNIVIENRIIWCHMNHALTEWCIHFFELNKTVGLAYPTDVRWNMEALYEVFQDTTICRKIAYAIKCVYEKFNYKDVSL